ncbi:hypothetical protein ACFX1X_008429 [Malus domestica]
MPMNSSKMVIQYADLLVKIVMQFVDHLPYNLHRSLTKRRLKLHTHEELFLVSLVSFDIIGYLKIMPLSKPKLNESREVQSKAQSSYNDEYGRVSIHYTENYKAEQLIDKSTSQLSYKQETKFTFTEKCVDKELGFTTEYQTQVKFKEFVYPNKFGFSSSKSNYNNNKNHNSILGN